MNTPGSPGLPLRPLIQHWALEPVLEQAFALFGKLPARTSLEEHYVSVSWRTAANFSSLPPCSPQLYVMEDKDKGKEGQITYCCPSKRGERSSDSSSPGSEKPPAKSVKFTESNMVEQADIWKVLNTIQDNTNKLLEENKALSDQYSELQKSLEFHIAKTEALTTENKALKKEMKSLKKPLNEANEEREEMYDDLGTAINQLTR